MDLAGKLFIDGNFVAPVNGGTFTNFKPTTGGKAKLTSRTYGKANKLHILTRN